MKALHAFIFLCLGLTGVMSLSEEMLELAQMLHNQCQDEEGTPEDLIVNARKGDWADDQTLKCYIKCLMAQMAVIDEDDGTIDVEGVVGLLPDEHKAMGERVVRKCGTKVGKDVCETAWLTHKCYQGEEPDHYFLP